MFLYRVEKTSKKNRGFSGKGFGELFNALHFVLVNNQSYNIAIHLRYTEKSELSLDFYSKSLEELQVFKNFVESEKDFKYFEGFLDINNHKDTYLKIRKVLEGLFKRSNLIGLDIKEVKEGEQCIIQKRTRTRLDHLNRKKLQNTIKYLFENFDKNFKGLKKDLKLIIKSQKLSLKDFENSEIFETVRERLKKGNTHLFIENVIFSDSLNKANRLFLKEEKLIDNKKMYKVNRYGLSTSDKYFCIPIS